MSIFDSVKRLREALRAREAAAAEAAPSLPRPAAPAPVEVDLDAIDESAIGETSDAAFTPTPEPAYAGPERRSKPRVNARPGTRALIVDDSTTIVAVLRRLLQQNAYQTWEAYNAEDALEIARDLQPEVIFLDIVLPGMDGFAALRTLRRDPATRDIPVIMISGNQQATEQFYVQRIGADDFMKKPFSRAEVFARIERLLDAEGVPRRAHLRGPVPEPTE